MYEIILVQYRIKNTEDLQGSLISFKQISYHLFLIGCMEVMLRISMSHQNFSIKAKISDDLYWKISFLKRRKRIPLLFLHFSIFLLVSCTTCDNHLDLYLQSPLYSMCFNVNIYVNSYKIFQCFVSTNEKDTILIYYESCLNDWYLFTCVYMKYIYIYELYIYIYTYIHRFL